MERLTGAVLFRILRGARMHLEGESFEGYVSSEAIGKRGYPLTATPRDRAAIVFQSAVQASSDMFLGGC
jgi:hypothetical protein